MCCCVLLSFTSADIIFHKFLELHSTLSEKKVFVTNFHFLTESLNAPPTSPLPQPLHTHTHTRARARARAFNGQNPLSVIKVFCWCSLNLMKWFFFKFKLRMLSFGQPVSQSAILNFILLMFWFSNEWMLKLIFWKMSDHFTMIDLAPFPQFCFVLFFCSI